MIVGAEITQETQLQWEIHFPRLFLPRRCGISFYLWKQNRVILGYVRPTEAEAPTPCPPLDCKEIQPVHPKGNQSWLFIGRTDGEAETPILWLPDAKSWLIRRDPDAGEDWRWEEKGTTEDEMVGWHHRLNGRDFEQTLGDSKGQGGLACSRSGSQRVRLDLATEQQGHGQGRSMSSSLFQNTSVSHLRLYRNAL